MARVTQAIGSEPVRGASTMQWVAHYEQAGPGCGRHGGGKGGLPSACLPALPLCTCPSLRGHSPQHRFSPGLPGLGARSRKPINSRPGALGTQGQDSAGRLCEHCSLGEQRKHLLSSKARSCHFAPLWMVPAGQVVISRAHVRELVLDLWLSATQEGVCVRVYV